MTTKLFAKMFSSHGSLLNNLSLWRHKSSRNSHGTRNSTRLIADVITGKLDVRDMVANLPDVNLDDILPPAEGGEADD